MRQYELADKAGVTRAMLSAYERGARMPTMKTLFKLLAALDADFRLFNRSMLAAAEEQSRRESLRSGST